MSAIPTTSGGNAVVTDAANAAVEAQPHDPAPKRKRIGRMRVYSRRYFRSVSGVLGLVMFFLLLLLALFGEIVVKQALGWDYKSTDFNTIMTGHQPSAQHWFGSTDVGGDIFAQTCHGIALSMRIAVLVSLTVTAISAVVGAGAAYLGGRWEKVILWIINFLMVVPTFLLLSLVANAAGGKWWVLALALMAFNWVFPSRVIWSLAMSVREREYVAAARYMGVRGFTTVVRHIVPNIGSLLIIQFALGIVGTVNAETSLSFLGFGIKIPEVSLGSLIGQGASVVSSQPWLFLFPAAALTMLTASMTLIADGLRDALDPNSAAGGKA